MEQSEFVVRKMTNDMRFVGLFTIIYGALSCISIIGAVIGIPLIIAGLRLRESADVFVVWLTSKEENKLIQGFDLQGKFFFIHKVIIIITLILFALYIIGMIAFFGFIVNEFSEFSQLM
jgi:uncharacterized Tic20 family protein